MKTARKHVPHLITAVLMLLGLMTAATAPAQAATQRVTAGASICSNGTIPAGWVITSSYSTNACPGTGVGYNITDSNGATGLSVCSMSPIPPNWVITWSYSTNNCIGTGVGYNIANVTNSTSASVCSMTPIPPNWVVTWSYSTNACAGTGVGYSIANVTNSTSASVCSFTPMPPNWVVTWSYSTNACVGTGVGYSIAKITTQTTASVCSFSPSRRAGSSLAPTAPTPATAAAPATTSARPDRRPAHPCPLAPPERGGTSVSTRPDHVFLRSDITGSLPPDPLPLHSTTERTGPMDDGTTPIPGGYWDPLPTARRLLVKNPSLDHFGGVWEGRNWRNVPGPFYGADTDTMQMGRLDAPFHIAYDDEFGPLDGQEFVYRQPTDAGQTHDLVNGCFFGHGGFAMDGDEHWTEASVREWWQERGRVREWAITTSDRWSRVRGQYREHYRDAAQGLRDYLVHLDGGLNTYLRGYLFHLAEGRSPLPGEARPELLRPRRPGPPRTADPVLAGYFVSTPESLNGPGMPHAELLTTASDCLTDQLWQEGSGSPPRRRPWPPPA